MGKVECEKVSELAEGYRERLTDVSWFMRVLNGSIAREANREDGVKGRFWEGRFKSQALLDEVALLSAMAYVDLNPIRASIARTPEQSGYTSIQARIEALAADGAPDGSAEGVLLPTVAIDGTRPRVAAKRKPAVLPVQNAEPLQTLTPAKTQPPLQGTSVFFDLPQARLAPFDATGQFEQAIPFAFDDYLELIDIVGRAIRPGKRGAIPKKAPRILTRLGLDTHVFIAHTSRFLKEFGNAVGRPEQLVALADKRQIKYLRGIATARALCKRTTL